MINFENIRKQSITKELLLSLIEKLYHQLNLKKITHITINELVDNVKFDKDTNCYVLTLMNAPVSYNDLIITSYDGKINVTPQFIKKIVLNRVFIQHNKIKELQNYFVTYKY